MKLMRIMIYESKDESRLKRTQDNSLPDGNNTYGEIKVTSYFIAEDTPEAQKVLDIKEEIEDQIEQNT